MPAIDDLIATVARLRAPGGCPWDIEQTHKSICDCLVEEVSELIDTIDRDDIPHMREELGDLLLHVVMHAQMAAERGDFSFEDVARDIDVKMIRRHPHVFGDNALADSAAVVRQWDEIKAREKKNGPANDGPFKDLHPSLSALLTAREVWKTVDKKKPPTPARLTRRASRHSPPGIRRGKRRARTLLARRRLPARRRGSGIRAAPAHAEGEGRRAGKITGCPPPCRNFWKSS